MNHGEKGQLILGISRCPSFANSRHHAVALWCSSRQYAIPRLVRVGGLTLEILGKCGGSKSQPLATNPRHVCGYLPFGRVMLFLGVFGILRLWLVSFESVFHGAGGCVSHARYYVRVCIEGDGYVGVS